MGCISKYGLIIINVFVVCLGLTVMGTGAAVIHQHYKFDVVLPNAAFAVPLTTLLTGIFLALLGFLGCIGAIKESRCMLMTYAVVVGLILVSVLTTGILLVVFTTDATDFLTDSMTDVYKQYGEEGKEELTHNLDEFQHVGKCCGINGYEDWANFPYRNGTSVPDGCCRDWTEGCGVNMLSNPDVEKLVWDDDCLEYVYYAFAVICIALAILSFILVGFQALSIAWACILARDSRRSNQVLIYSSYS